MYAGPRRRKLSLGVKAGVSLPLKAHVASVLAKTYLGETALYTSLLKKLPPQLGERPGDLRLFSVPLPLLQADWDHRKPISRVTNNS